MPLHMFSLPNIYAAAGKWEEVSSVRTSMQERGVYKESGRSWIEVRLPTILIYLSQPKSAE